MISRIRNKCERKEEMNPATKKIIHEKDKYRGAISGATTVVSNSLYHCIIDYDII